MVLGVRGGAASYQRGTPAVSGAEQKRQWGSSLNLSVRYPCRSSQTTLSINQGQHRDPSRVERLPQHVVSSNPCKPRSVHGLGRASHAPMLPADLRRCSKRRNRRTGSGGNRIGEPIQFNRSTILPNTIDPDSIDIDLSPPQQRDESDVWAIDPIQVGTE